MAELIEGAFSKVPDEAWRDRLISARDRMAKRTIPAFIEFCREVHAFRENCDATQGGSEFSRKGCEWLGVSSTTLHRWDAVGRRGNELSHQWESLPHNEAVIADVAMLDDIAFRKTLPQLKPEMPQKEVRALIKELDPRPEPTAQEQEDAIERKRQRLYKQFKELPPKHQFVLGRAICSDLEAKGWKP